jgi:hypothetical protein
MLREGCVRVRHPAALPLRLENGDCGKWQCRKPDVSARFSMDDNATHRALSEREVRRLSI